MKIKKLLVANRGEIAIRIIRTAQELGIKTVAVYSEADHNALHRHQADESICIGPAASKESYLCIPSILNAAKKSRADAVHPGYGFLSENTDFARQINKAGLIFIGPKPETIEAMGDKVKARETVEAFQVPTVPGTKGFNSIDEGISLVSELEKSRPDFKYPLLIKAAGGGGGKGMRIARRPEELRSLMESAQSEASKSFNNPKIFVERFIENPRHIEVQILGDGQAVCHLFERECSLQRRHQKVVEEALSPSLDPQTRQKILEAGVNAARSVQYCTAGTVEFIVSAQNDFYFLEMNTRIQVEHPVTEWITGYDLIREQMTLACGEKLKDEFFKVQPRGHSIEVRLYAEDCENGFLPQPGPLHFLKFPHWTGVRVDTAVESPTIISDYYDPMIAKISGWAPTRVGAIERMRLFLQNTRIEGLISNKSFLIDILKSEFMKKGHYHTQLLETPNWRPQHKPSLEQIAALCLKDHRDRKLIAESKSLSPWQLSLSESARK